MYADNVPDFTQFPFTVMNPGSEVSTYDHNYELDYFPLFFMAQLMDNIVHEANC